MTAPKYLQELYGPISPEKWAEWLAFRDRAKAVLSSPSCTWKEARTFYDNEGKVADGLHSAASSMDTKRPFPWCGLSLHLQTCTRSISLWVETSDSDVRTLAEFIED